MNYLHTHGYTSPGITWLMDSIARGEEAFNQRYEEIRTGRKDWSPFVPAPSWGEHLSVFALSLTATYRAEMDAELARRKHAPTAPSRFSSLYAFGDYTSAADAADFYKLSESDLRRVRLHEDVPPLAVARCNMSTVSFARRLYAHQASWDPTDIDELWSSYWKGETGPSAMEVPVWQGSDKRPPLCREVWEAGSPLWEWVIDGRVTFIDPHHE